MLGTLGLIGNSIWMPWRYHMARASRQYKVLAAILITATLGSSCGGSSDMAVPLTAVAADSGIAPNENGFSFANFGSSATPENFNADDLLAMFGTGACVDGKTSPCSPSAQAAKWAQMVNESRASGHCEGLAVQAAVRFDQKASPSTVKLFNTGDVTHGIIRAFATQYLPEVQDATNAWAKKSLVEIVNELSTAFQSGKASYTMGLYTPTGGHAVLPYAIQFPSPELAVVKVYDSNWPGMERFVVIDLKAKTWYFSFSGTDPQKDECAWSGSAGDIDITPMDTRTSATCPFCGDGTKVTKSVLLIRSTDVNWSIKTKNGTFTPSSAEVVSDVSSKAIRTATCDKVVEIPEFILTTDSTDFELTLPDTTSAYISNGDSVVQIVTKGSKTRRPIIFNANTVSVQDPSTQLTVAADNVVAQVTSDLANITIDNNLVSIDLGGAETPIIASPEAPQIVVTSGGDVPAVVTEVSNLVSVEPTIVAELVPPPVKAGLSETTNRDLTNPTYFAFVENTPISPVTALPVSTTTTSTTAKSSPASKATTSTIKSSETSNGAQEAAQAEVATTIFTTTPTTGSTATTVTNSTATTRAPGSAATTTTIPSPTTTSLIDVSSVRVKTSPNARNSTSITVRVYSNEGSTPGNTDYNTGPFVLVGSCTGTNCADKTYPWPIGYGWKVTIDGCPSWSGQWESHFPAFSYGWHKTNDQSTCDP